MNIAEIKASVDAGQSVHWASEGYRVHPATTDGMLHLMATDATQTQLPAAIGAVGVVHHAEATAAPRATPPERTFLFIHELESAMLYSVEACELWCIGLCVGLADVDETSPELWGCSRMLKTKAIPHGKQPGQGGYHGSMGSDGAMPKKNSGYPVNQHVWQYVLTADV